MSLKSMISFANKIAPLVCGAVALGLAVALIVLGNQDPSDSLAILTAGMLFSGLGILILGVSRF